MERNQKTFWTKCPSCRTKSLYHIEFLNRFLVCQACRNTFEARELPPDGLNLRNHKDRTKAEREIHLSMERNQKTFRTKCPSCCTELLYHIEFLNRFLVCQACQNTFEARELPDGVNLRNHSNNKDPTKAGNLIDLTADETLNDDEEVRVLRFKPSNISFGKRKRNEEGSCSNSKPLPSFACEICLETKSPHDSFGIKNCSHVFCTDCVVKYVDSKLQQNIASIGCPVPGCKGSLDPEHCHSIMEPEVFEKWGVRLCEDLIMGSQKFYCPFKNCSAMLIDDGSEVVRESKCPHCRRFFCAQCKVPWHARFTCAEFKRLDKDDAAMNDIKMKKLAYKKHWGRCPNCGIYVEKIEGCGTMRCMCGWFFIFFCGKRGCTFCREDRTISSPIKGGFVVMEEY